MLAHILAIAVGLGSFALYMAAFFYPEVYRRNDFIWSGVGLFYALVLWICAGRITGGVLLGQMAGVTLLMGLGWQLLELRREKTPSGQQTEVSPQVRDKLSTWFTPLSQILNQLRTTSSPVKAVKVEDVGEAVLETPPSEPPANLDSEPMKTSSEIKSAVVETSSKPPKMNSPNPVAEFSGEQEIGQKPAQKEVVQPKPSMESPSTIDDFWEDETPILEDKSEVPEPAIVTNLEDLTNLDRPVDN
ncbi:Ycf66 family protein [Spirulina sp. 06S082]|uniref:Ycf66 family protein n=1 Tax=Spirulina sp. 06S082 TaxID=3110248 RepID=UPI002B210EA5|nr:Ycf66 family protein [Spirulina sp. 06S082]MEA5472585.1 Ycf66 family protein [Spirulina sp. 06S082]